MLRAASSFQDFEFPSGASNLFLRRFAERVGMNGERQRQFAFTQNLYALVLGTDDAVVQQSLRGDAIARGIRLQSLDIHHCVLGRKRAAKTALRYPPVQRHLAAFKSGPT